MLIPAPPRPNLWYYRDDCLKMALDPKEVEISPMGHDTFITKEIDGQRFDALVPTRAMGKNLSSVPVAYAGKTDDGRVILYLPTSNEGRPTWVIPEKFLDSLLVKKDAPLG